MQNRGKRKRIRLGVEIAVIALFCAAIILLDIFSLPWGKDAFLRNLITKNARQTLGCMLAIWCVLRFKLRLFGKVEKWLWLLPCLLVAINNLPWHAYFTDKMQIGRTGGVDILLFVAACITTAFFEELVFRGILFALLASLFVDKRRGLWWTFFTSSVLFGLSHLFNGISGATLLQVGYTTLTGGLFAFCFIKTKNILCPTLVHATYNVCGTLFDAQNGLGSGVGVVFDLGSALTMAIIGVFVGIIVLYKLFTYPKAEEEELFGRIGAYGKKKD